LVTVRLAALGALREADMPVNTEYQSTLGIVGLTSLSSLSVQGLVVTGSSQLLGSANLISASTVTVTSQISAARVVVGGGPTLSAGSLDLRTNSVVLSMATAADSSGLTIGQLRLVFLASGISLIYGSGKSYYIVGHSAVSAVQD
jgi:hypothetical protein